MSLRNLVQEKLFKSIIEQVKDSKKVLVCDDHALGYITTFCSMKQILDLGVSSIENLARARQPLDFSAIYIITPQESNVKQLLKDFTTKRVLYTRCYIYFTSSVTPSVLSLIKANKQLLSCLKALSEAHIDYYMPEARCFYLFKNNKYDLLYSSDQAKSSSMLSSIQSQLLSVCVTCKAVPTVLYQKASKLCTTVGSGLRDNVKDYFKSSGIEAKDASTTIVILERSFDGITPLLHELTLQAMGADLLNLNENVYVSKGPGSSESKTILDDSNDVWVSVRHNHIAQVLKDIPEKVREIASKNKMNLSSSKGSLQDIKSLLSKLPQYRAELAKYQTMLQYSEDCFKIFDSKQIETLCYMEQDLATGIDKNGEKVTDPIAHMFPIIQGKHSGVDKLRVSLLYALSQDSGIPVENMDRILEHGKLTSEKNSVLNFKKVNMPLLENEVGVAAMRIKRSQQFNEGGYALSRYQPVIKILFGEFVKQNIKNQEFEVVGDWNLQSKSIGSGTGDFNFGKWKSKEPQKQTGQSDSRLIFFIIGGMTYSEIRTAYQIAEESGIDVVIGGTSVLTPEGFIDSIKKL